MGQRHEPPPSGQTPGQAAAPRFGAHFDPWNSSSTGHQRPENQPGTGWRESRTRKLNSQLASRSSGGERLVDTWGPNSDPKNLKLREKMSVAALLAKPGKMKEALSFSRPDDNGQAGEGLSTEDVLTEKRKREDEDRAAGLAERGIFDGVVVYVNGSTYPLVSDHRLKQILRENGANMSIHLGRRTVTHVIIGRPAGAAKGAGGGLAAGKLEKEIKKIAGCGVKFVGVEWVLESLKAGKRLPEARFTDLKIALKGQGSVYGLYANGLGSASTS